MYNLNRPFNATSATKQPSSWRLNLSVFTKLGAFPFNLILVTVQLRFALNLGNPILSTLIVYSASRSMPLSLADLL